MEKKKLYTSDAVYLTEHNSENFSDSNFVRLIADNGKAITDGETIITQADVPKKNVTLWTDCELPPEEDEATETDYQNELRRLGVEV